MGDSLPGTLVVDEDEIGDDMERQLITGVAYNRNEAKITLVNVPDRPSAVATIFSPLAEANINVDMIIQNIAHDEGSTDVTFTVPQSDLLKSIDVLEKATTTIGFERFTSDDNVTTKIGNAHVITPVTNAHHI